MSKIWKIKINQDKSQRTTLSLKKETLSTSDLKQQQKYTKYPKTKKLNTYVWNWTRNQTGRRTSKLKSNKLNLKHKKSIGLQAEDESLSRFSFIIKSYCTNAS